MSERRLRLLCLDGGGVRGLAQLYMLRQLLGQVGDPKPCKYFDMICGTSTGGLIAIMLGRLEMNIDDCIEAFTEMMDEIFKQKAKIPFKLFSGKAKPRYDSATLERCIKKVVTNTGLPPDAKLRDRKYSNCKVFVTAMTGEARAITRFTDYKGPADQQDIYEDIKIWEAARATFAATSFFAPIKIKSRGLEREFRDGGLGTNNPVYELWQEAVKAFGPLEPQIQCLLSIGTGRPKLEAFGKSILAVGREIINIAIESQAAANRFEVEHEDLFTEDRAFRFNPPDINEVGLEDASEKAIIAIKIAEYCNNPENEGRLTRFKNAVSREQIALTQGIKVEALTQIIPRSNSPDFHSLGGEPKHILPNANSYWRHLTLSSYKIYEEIYMNCKSDNGQVRFSWFCDEFNLDKIKLKIIEEVWSRLLKDKREVRKSIHPKGFAMATLYMLHIEMHLSIKPFDEDKVGGAISKTRRELLEKFGNWVPCQCREDCGLTWNFANDMGLYRGERRIKCAMMKLFQTLSFKDFSVDKGVGIWKLTREAWMNSSAQIPR